MDNFDKISVTQERYGLYLMPTMSRIINFAGYGVEEVSAQGMFVTDHRGEEWLDFCSGYGVMSMGHRHPRIIAAAHAQLDLMSMSARVFYNPVQAELAERLAKLLPGDLQYSFFCNSGTEAVEGALKLARLATGRSGIVAAENSFHGKTLGALSVTGRPLFRIPYEPLLPGVTFVPYGDIEALRAAVNEETAAVILESIQGEGGIMVPPDGYLRAVREISKACGALLILDEVQTGLGRTGYTFGFEHEGIVPDIVCLAKALGGGVMPIGAFVGTPAVWQAFRSRPLIHTSTFGGNPLACAVSLAALDVLKDERLAQRSRQMGFLLKNGLDKIRQRHPISLAEVRGRGLLIGVELTHARYGGVILPEMARQHIILVYTLNQPKVIRFEPPLIVEYEHIFRVLAAFEAAVTRAEKDLGESSKK
ncbi:MAG: aspartate aminotransferase family protein [Patescibacteria group bacterium]